MGAGLAAAATSGDTRQPFRAGRASTAARAPFGGARVGAGPQKTGAAVEDAGFAIFGESLRVLGFRVQGVRMLGLYFWDWKGVLPGSSQGSKRVCGRPS